MKLTADTITAEQIRELRASARNKLPRSKFESRSEALGLIETCDLALGETLIQTREDVREAARFHCAIVWNARHATDDDGHIRDCGNGGSDPSDCSPACAKNARHAKDGAE